MVLGGFLVTFGDPEDIFSDFRGYRNRDRGRDRGRDRDRDSLGDPKSREPSQWVVTLPFWGQEQETKKEGYQARLLDIKPSYCLHKL